MWKELFIADVVQLSSYLPELTQWLPFDVSKKIAYDSLKKRVQQFDDQHYITAIMRKNRPKIVVDFTLTQHIMTINLVLIADDYRSWSMIVDELVILAKQHRMKILRLGFSRQVMTDYLVTKLTDQGFDVETDDLVVQFDYPLIYYTGLVLGGGGAKGSYQIGVWKALKELNVTYELVSGTSVGALNGGLIIQDDLPSAIKMWETIATQDILSVPISVVDTTDDFTLQQLMSHVQSFTLSAMKTVGADTTPLLNLIHELIHEEKIFQTDKKFFIVTTQAPMLTETVVSLSDMTIETLPKWLLASASFFPAMSACVIDGKYYVDGGYRNNLPSDVLLNEGATEIITVNVKGPGFIKSSKMEVPVAVVNIESDWGLGNVLLFDSHRASWNLQLGYLEGLKAFGQLRGTKYSFPKIDFKRTAFNASRRFIHYLQQRLATVSSQEQITSSVVERLLQQGYNPSVLVVDLLEELAFLMVIDPTKVYSLAELGQAIVQRAHHLEATKTAPMMLSFKEWLIRYLDQIDYLSPQQKLIDMYQLLQNEEEKQLTLTKKEVTKHFHLLVTAIFLEYLGTADTAGDKWK
ncbi:hypothetical protein CBF34_06570 [Vagococcus penaei]|uniref:Uncharacterized protein n=1 Tax=Vagococcus penaei TaxID=633807 RepID=A0A1Q2D6W2_9ENTE|nr:patatin-like phospholipase family protein [Vagococcus penaei]AQP54053.1 hypothetical protein BW732_07375 [Vagococcus penaei]RSU01713.1 hypothetical protein CBF34_06570 [Vagococcus penaei]